MTNQDLPAWRNVLAVVAHPDDESFGLGAILSTFVDRGAQVSVLCFTHGEASTLQGVDGDLRSIRERELHAAADELAITNVTLLGHPDGNLQSVALETLRDAVVEAVKHHDIEGLLVFDPSGVTGHLDHSRATRAALDAAIDHALPVLAWTLPKAVSAALSSETGGTFIGHDANQIDLVIDVDRTKQLRAVDCHPSQAIPTSVLWRRLELLGAGEHLRWLNPPTS